MQNSDKTDESIYQTVQIWSGIFIELSGVYDFEFDKSEINHSNWITIRMFQDSSNKAKMNLNEIKRMKRYRTESTYSTTATLADFDISTRCKTVLKLTMHFRCICNTIRLFQDYPDILKSKAESDRQTAQKLCTRRFKNSFLRLNKSFKFDSASDRMFARWRSVYKVIFRPNMFNKILHNPHIYRFFDLMSKINFLYFYVN